MPRKKATTDTKPEKAVEAGPNPLQADPEAAEAGPEVAEAGPEVAEAGPNPVQADPEAAEAGSEAGQAGLGTWVVLPTYNEADNIGPISAAILAALPSANLLVVDDGSPDGTGRLGDELAARDGRVRVRHRPAKQGLGRAYLEGFAYVLHAGAAIVVQMDADWSHDPNVLPQLVAPIVEGNADLVIGSRYVTGGGVEDWGIGRRIISRGGSQFARTVLGLPAHDLTGGFKAWRAATLSAVPFEGIHAGGYVFQIEMTYRASRAGARVVELPITFRDRRVGTSKMSRRIVAEALLVVLRLRSEELAAGMRARRRKPGSSPDSSREA